MCPFVLEFSFSAFGVCSLENQNTLFFPLVVPTFQCALGCAALEWAEPTVGGFSQVEGGGMEERNSKHRDENYCKERAGGRYQLIPFINVCFPLPLTSNNLKLRIISCSKKNSSSLHLHTNQVLTVGV